ncbi:hypothetical protein FOZ60_006566 [Perkinsus olseni]|uniref:Uncharacterized protein n=1 Tax=Perkinsus olseni TaxID=32597 RepID=A0A7J6NPJ0_PEROL|nr:hypothetical protein FOZ60_006566 [Perkinsus olseni]
MQKLAEQTQSNHPSIVSHTCPIEASGAPRPVTSPTSCLSFGIKQRDMLGIVPSCITNGMVIAYVFGSFSRYLVAPILGIRTTVAAQSLFFIFNALFTLSWGRLLFTGRDPDRDGALQWIQIDTPTKAEYFTIAGLIILLAFGDSLYEFELPASIQARFAPTRYHLVAISNYKAYHSLGYFIQFTIDLSLGDDSLNSFYRGGIVHPSLILITKMDNVMHASLFGPFIHFILCVGRFILLRFGDCLPLVAMRRNPSAHERSRRDVLMYLQQEGAFVVARVLRIFLLPPRVAQFVNQSP